jgi:hypothetical protein
MDTEELPETPFERFVLLTVADLTQEDEAPVHSFDVREQCTAHTVDVTCAEGGVERAAVLQALEALVEFGALAETETTSPVGKGRPGFELTGDPAAIIDALAADDAVGTYAASLQD